jgi:hypothetical protein
MDLLFVWLSSGTITDGSEEVSFTQTNINNPVLRNYRTLCEWITPSFLAALFAKQVRFDCSSGT